MDRLPVGHSITGLLAQVVVCLLGCSPEAALLNPECVRVETGGRLAGVRFGCDLQTRYMLDCQILYQVTLSTRQALAVRSRDKRYDVNGQVGATRTFMVLSSSQTFKNIGVTIPADQLEFGQDDMPVTATFAALSPDGKCLAKESRVVPVVRASEIRPPLTLPAAERWFAKRPSRNGLLILIGPYDSMQEARKALRGGPDSRLVKFKAGQRLWFVPLREPGRGQAVLIGPCNGERAADKVVRTLRKAAGARREAPEIAAPLSLELEAWLSQRAQSAVPGPSAEMVEALKRLGLDAMSVSAPPSEGKAPS